MKSENLCFNHAKEKIDSLFVSQRLIIDTNIGTNKPIHCEYKHPLVPGITCDMIASVKVTVLGRRDKYVDVLYIQDTEMIRSETPTEQSTLES